MEPRLSRRCLLRTGLVAGAGAIGAPFLGFGRSRLWAAARPGEAAHVSHRAIELVAESTVIDMLSLLTLDWPRLFAWYADPSRFTADDFARLKRSGVDVFHPAVDPNRPDPHDACREWLAGWNRLIAAHPRWLQRVDGPDDLVAARRGGRLGLLLGFQNSTHFREPADVARFHRRGQRVSQLTYDRPNGLGGGCREADPGLTAFGAAVVAEMNRVGMAIDVSHCGERTTLDTFAASRRPVLVTHANCQALVPGHPRCKSDRVLEAMARQGGVIGITAVRAFVAPTAEVGLEHLLDHFDHVARRVGPEHVGLGSDVDVDALDPATRRVRPPYAIRGLDHRHRTYLVADGLLRRGWRDDDVRLALGGNFARALGDIMAPAAA